MKKIIYSLTAVLALAACSKEQESLDYELFDGEVSTIIAKFNPVTKTTVELAGDQAAYTWEESETISVFNGSTALTYTVVDRNAGTFQYAGDPAGELAYAVSPADALSSPSAGSYKLTIKSNYTGYKSNVSNAIMVAGAPSDVIDDKPVFAFQHAAALMRFTYENVPVGTTGLKFSTDKKINGTFTVSGSTPELTLANASGTTETKLTLASAVTSANTSIIFYVPIPTGNYSTFTVTLFNGEGDIASTTKTMNAAFTATKGHVINTPVITLSHIDAVYSRITNIGDLTSGGQYLIVYETGSVIMDGSKSSGIDTDPVSVSISSNTIEATAAIDAKSFTISSISGGYSIYASSGKYISGKSGGVTMGDAAVANTISFSGNNVVISSNSYTLKFNSAGATFFRYYSSGQKAIQLYKKVLGSGKPQLSVPQSLSVDASTKRVSWHSVAGASKYTVTINDVAHEDIVNTFFISDIEDGYYDVSVIAVSSDPSSTLDSNSATLKGAKFGNPRLAAPAGFSKGDVTNTSIQVSWGAVSNATKYHCSISPNDDEDKDVTSQSVTFSGLTEGNTYTISVYAIDETGAYGNSTAGTISVKAEVSYITIPDADITNAGLTGTVNGETGYKVGTGKNTQTLTIAKGYSKIQVFAAGWNGETTSLSVSNGTFGSSTSVNPPSSSNVSGINAEGFSITDVAETQYTITVTNTNNPVVLTMKRGVIWHLRGIVTE